ncbi:MAG: FecR domain-containing protein [Cycloclasticus sp.]|jgi:Fe2+-dicitrate sensor, membrane component
MEQAFNNNKNINHDLLQQAAEWFSVLQSDAVTEQERQDWQNWLSSDELHRDAWRKVENISHRFTDLPISTAQVVLDPANKSAISRRTVLKSLAFACISTGSLWQLARHQYWDAQYRTAYGEIRQINLDDGAKVWLNTNSAIDVVYTATSRQIILHSGEIHIETAVDIAPYTGSKKRSMLVETKFGRLRALGTKFNVRDNQEHIVLSVTEGAVEVVLKDQAQTKRVDTGQQVAFTLNSIQPVSQDRATKPVWTKGVILADNMRLDDFIDELNRYFRGHLSYDSAAASMRLVGAYPVNDIDRVLVALEKSLPLTINRALPWWVRIEAKEG